MLDSPEGVCAGQAGSEYPATSVPFSKVNREGQITERFTRAVDQLGNRKSLDVRVGGIFALERIARESEKDRRPIGDILATYVRDKSTWPPKDGISELDAKYDADQAHADTESVVSPIPILGLKAADIQAAMDVLGRGSFQQKSRKWSRGLVLVAVDLRRADLIEMDLSKAYLTNSNLQWSYLTECNLTETMFVKTNLAGAVLVAATCIHTDFEEADLRWAQLQDAIVTGADFRQARLNGADLTGTNLAKANLQEARADSSTIWPSNFDRAAALQAGVIMEDENSHPQSSSDDLAPPKSDRDPN
jgi:hypothetical protein